MLRGDGQPKAKKHKSAAREALRGEGERLLDLIFDTRPPGEVVKWLAPPLASATARGDERLSKKLLQAGATFEGDALPKAIRAGQTAIVDLLLENGADVQEAEDEEYMHGTPLNIAAASNQMDIARLLLRKGADVNYVDGDHNTPLTLALQEGNDAMVELLLNAGADPAVRVTEFDLSALDLVTSGDAVRLLLKHGARVDAVSSSGQTALHAAAEIDTMTPIQALVEAGADLEAEDMAGQTPLHIAAGAGYTDRICPEAALALLNLGAEVNAQTDGGETALHFAAARAGARGSVETVDLLLKWGADETIVSERRGGKTARELVNTRNTFWKVPGDDERVLTLLARAPANRAWGRRGLMVLCREYPDRVQLGGNLASLATRLFGLEEVGVFRKIVLYL